MPIENWQGEKLLREIVKRQHTAVAQSCAFLEGYIKRSMAHTKRDRSISYRRGKTAYHYPSYPGHPPAPDTGRLRASITWRTSWGKGSSHPDGVGVPKVRNWLRVRGIVGTNVEYAPWLELGTPRMAPRPFLRVALEKNKSKILWYFKKQKLTGGIR